ncbi:MAG: class I SAM-dependent methyltransferase, partial [Actinomycetota bacterium]|nr:class I SAM-dependent methyltransferase [Actinomycetota bacterium]
MYEGFAEDYLVHAGQSAYNAYYDRPAVLEALGPVDGMRILDAGCGPGLLSRELVAGGAASVVGVDASARMVDLATQNVAGPVEFRVHDLAEPLSWLDDGSFDVAVMALVIHHLDDRSAALREIARFLRPGGRLVISTHHPTGDWVGQGGSYFAVEKISETWSRGWQMTYWRQPLELTCREFIAAGFLIEGLYEPRPSEELRQRYPDAAEKLSREPGFIVFRLFKPSAP